MIWVMEWRSLKDRICFVTVVPERKASDSHEDFKDQIKERHGR